jgi:hypothetical protein
MDKQEKDSNRDYLVAKASFLQEMIAEKTEQFNLMFEALKRYEGHAAGSKDVVEKFSSYIKKQQVDIEGLAVQQKLAPEISNFVKAILDGAKTCVRSICGDVEKIYFSKQGELLFLQQEIEKLIQQKLTLETSAKELEEASKTSEESVVEEVTSAPDDGVLEKSKKKKRVRPDQDPTTRVGKAALDLASRRKKYQKKSP